LTTASDNPLISVVLACYNQEKFIGEAIDGVLSQTYSPLEILIVDDCSTDSTAGLIEAKLSAHPERRDIGFIRNEKNLTMMRSTLRAIGMTKGRFVVVTSGDDILLPDMVEGVAKIWREQNVSLVITNATYIDDDSKPLNRTFRDPDESADDSFETLARDGANACCFGPCMSFERELFDTFGLPPAHLECADIMYPFYAHLLKGARFVSKPLFMYRVHSSNTSLSLIAEKKSNELERLLVLERDFCLRLNHAVFMEEELDRMRREHAPRYAELARETFPLLTIQIVETAKKLVRTRRLIVQIRESLVASQ
jgi:glycosyltransferase involved in cell wall biosynthesis